MGKRNGMKPLLKDPEQQKMYEHLVAMNVVTWLLLVLFMAVWSLNHSQAIP